MTCPPCTHDCNQGRTCPAQKNEIIEMARHAGAKTPRLIWPPTFTKSIDFTPDALEAFAELVAAQEREACAKVCDELFADVPAYSAPDCAVAIRARGQR